MVQARTRIMNQLQAVALNEGLRCKKRLWRDRGREQLESFRLAPWASRRRRESSGMRRSEFCQSRGLSFSTLDRHLKKRRWKRRRRRV
jgi:hypothetical protein